MARFLVRRLLIIIPLLFAVMLISFGLVSILEIRGNVADEILGEGAGDQAAVKALEANLGLDRALPVRFAQWSADVVHGDLGHSLYQREVPVTSLLSERIWPTVSIVTLGLLLSCAFGIAFGALSGLRPGGKLDRALSIISASVMATPAFVVGMLLIVIFAVQLGWFEPTGFVSPSEGGWWAWLRSITLPAIALAIPYIAIIQRQLRSAMSTVLQSRYVLAARARGIPTGTIVVRHAMRNAMIPTVTVIGFQAANAIGLSIAVEKVFNIEGLGSLLVGSVTRRDVPVVQGIILVAGILVAVTNLLVDLSYGWLNPRVRFE